MTGVRSGMRRRSIGRLLERLEPRVLLSGDLVAVDGTVARVQAEAGFHPTYEVMRAAGAGAMTPMLSAGPQGFSPAQLRAAYGMNQITFGSVSGDGSGQYIAIIDAYNDPTITADLHAFDLAMGLSDPAFKVVAQDGSSNLPGVDPAGRGASNFEGEEALDVEWAHAMAPGAGIFLVEARDASPANLFAAVNWARQQAGISVISMSFGGNETSNQSQYDGIFTTPAGHGGVTFVASTGDSGAPAGFPAYSANVVATGGTSLSIDAVGNYQAETAWSGSGGGISQVEARPSYQAGTATGSAAFRTVPDVAFDADPSTGVAVYDSYNNGTATPWQVVGGTSLAAPAWAGIIAVADQGRALAGKGTLDSASGTLPLLYAAPAADFHDVTTGSNGYAAGAGYDLVTGRGSPKANLLVGYLVSGSVAPPPPTTGPSIASITASAATVAAGTPLTLTAVGVSDPGGTGLTVTFYEESNGLAGLQTDPATGDTSFTPVTNGSNSVTLDTTGAAGTYVFYAQLTDASGAASAAGTGAPKVTVTVTAGGTGPVIASISAAPNPVVSGSTLTLTANGVADPVAAVQRVTFYEETNGLPGLQTGTGGDFAFPSVTALNNYALNLDTTGVTGAYTFYARAVDSLGNVSASGMSAPSAMATILTAAVPATPTSLTAAAVSSTEVDLSFAESGTVQTGFTVERSQDAGFTTFTHLLTINRPNVLTYSDTGLSPGTTYFYRVQAFDAAGSSGFSNVASATTEANHVPMGSIDVADGSVIAGWGFDQETGSAAAQVRVDVDGVAGTPFAAGGSRPDLAGWLGSAGHGFAMPTPALGPGLHTVALWVQDAGGSGFYEVAARVIDRAPVGSIDVADGAMIAGWGFDWDAGAASVAVRVDIDGVAGTPVSASGTRPDLAGWLGSAAHGYTVAVPAYLGPGVHTVTLWVQDSPSGTFLEVASKRINRAPIGSIDVASGAMVAGWVFDWDSAAAATNAVVVVDGQVKTPMQASAPRPDLAGWLGSADHGYVFQLQNLALGTHTVQVFAQDDLTHVWWQVGAVVVTV